MWLCVGAPSVLPCAHCLPLAGWHGAAPFPGSNADDIEGFSTDAFHVRAESLSNVETLEGKEALGGLFSGRWLRGH